MRARASSSSYHLPACGSVAPWKGSYRPSRAESVGPEAGVSRSSAAPASVVLRVAMHRSAHRSRGPPLDPDNLAGSRSQLAVAIPGPRKSEGADQSSLQGVSGMDTAGETSRGGELCPELQ